MKNIEAYKKSLENNQLGKSTIDIYIREARNLESYMKGKDRTKTNYIAYIDYLKNLKVKGKPKYKLVTLNNKIILINKYLKFIGEESNTLKEFKIQDQDNVMTLTDNDYKRILRQAHKKGTERDVLMLEALYYTGVRVSELEYFTVEALKKGYMEVTNKGKTRVVGISKKLDKQGKEYISKNKIKEGAIILNNQGKPLSRNYVYKRMKYLGGQARVSLKKVYPHSIRHLFAKNMVEKHNINPLQLADILGHESISTTRRYTKLGLDEVKKLMDF